MNAHPPTTSLQHALDQALRYGPRYRDNPLFVSHLPMVLTALARLGAPPVALERQLAHWATLLPDAVRREDTPPPELSALLPHLLEAPESAAFHGAIRLAYALEAGHAGELAEALAFWRDSWCPLGAPPAAVEGSATLREAIDALRADAGLVMPKPPAPAISQRLTVAHALLAFNSHVARPRLSLDALAEASLAVYLGSRDFTALHLVTGLHAVRVLLSQGIAIDEGQVLRALWRAWAAAYVSIGRPAPAWELVHAGTASEAHWAAVAPALFDSLNDHRIKLADASHEEWRARGWPGYALCVKH